MFVFVSFFLSLSFSHSVNNYQGSWLDWEAKEKEAEKYV